MSHLLEDTALRPPVIIDVYIDVIVETCIGVSFGASMFFEEISVICRVTFVAHLILEIKYNDSN
jgi:hypothetical protein